ncbi:hypothetical protein M3Y98_00095500 [Aphelenchoides besseyi]|nr:hypothetical protein M3Y98_00095500 [Aphelenchoides besseyi]KAI6198557.1 hypothetical protein M3Y96_00531900 [Aphelenchoides besseyi]
MLSEQFRRHFVCSIQDDSFVLVEAHDQILLPLKMVVNLNLSLDSELDSELKSSLSIEELDEESLSKKIWELRKENKLVDFSLKVDGQSIGLHKGVLAKKSEFFSDLFQETPSLSEYTIDDTTINAVESMVGFLYLNVKAQGVEVFSNEFLQLYKLSVRFSVHELHQVFEIACETGIFMESAFDLLVLAVKNKDHEQIKMIIEFAEKCGGREKITEGSEAYVNLRENDSRLFLEVLEALIW